MFFKDPEVIEATLSPSGSMLAIATLLGANHIGLAMMDLTLGGKFTRIVQFRDGDVRGGQWVNDHRFVFTLTDFSAGSGRPNGAPSRFAIKPDGSQLLQLQPARGRHDEAPRC